MKKKIINGIMMVALVAATSTSFVSCKDTNEDVRIEQAAEIAALQDRLDLLEEQYGDLEGRVTTLRNQLNVTNANVEILDLRCDQLEDWLKDTFAKLVTSVEINGTWNNMTGMVAIPGVKANMLIANYGEAGKDGKLPVNGKLADGEKPIEWFAGDKFGYDKDNATYAGTIYATVNKYISGDFELAEDKFGADLVTTSGNACDLVSIALGNDGKPTDKDLTWGWTRADNSVYEFNIGVKANPEELGFNILKIEGLKDDIKTILKNRQHTSAQEFAQAVAKLYYTAIQGGAGSNMPMYALRLGWAAGNKDQYTKDAPYVAKYQKYNSETEKDEEMKDITWIQPEFMKSREHFVQSDADLLLATIKPLAFTTKDVPVSITPKVQMTLDQAEKIFNRMVASVNSVVSRAVADYKGFDKGGNAEDYTLRDMMISSIVDIANNNGHLVGGTAAADVDLVKGQIYYVEGATANAAPYYIYSLVDGNPSAALPDGAADITNDVTANFINLNQYFAEYLSTEANKINRAIELVQEALNYAQGDMFKNKIADRVLNYSAKLDKWLGENFNHGLQPTLFAIHGVKKGTQILKTIDTTNAKLNRVSGIEGAPLTVTGGEPVVLKATSYTVETFAPIKAKFVTISAIDGKEITAAQAEALSYDINNGAKLAHITTSYIDQYAFIPEAGKTYTILYEAVDYFGNTFSKEYYIKGE
jgi:hypothetical protein